MATPRRRSARSAYPHRSVSHGLDACARTLPAPIRGANPPRARTTRRPHDRCAVQRERREARGACATCQPHWLCGLGIAEHRRQGIGGSRLAEWRIAEAPPIARAARRLADRIHATLRRLHVRTRRLLSSLDLHSALCVVLSAAIELQQADFGDIHVPDGSTGTLRLSVQQGLPAIRKLRPGSRCNHKTTYCSKALLDGEPKHPGAAIEHMDIAKVGLL